MKRKIRISRLKREIKRLHKENKKLHDKHWSECRQIALYDDEVRVLRTENAELKRLLKLAVEDLQYFSQNDFEPSWKCEICEKFVKSNRRCEKMSDCAFAWYKLKECEQICKRDEHWRYLDEANEVVLERCAEHPETPESVSEQPEEPEKPKKTYKEDFLEKFPNARRYYYGDPASCRKNIYGHGIPNCPGYDGKDGRNCVGCWNEVMKDETD